MHLPLLRDTLFTRFGVNNILVLGAFALRNQHCSALIRGIFPEFLWPRPDRRRLEFLFTAGTTLLTETYLPDEKAKGFRV